MKKKAFTLAELGLIFFIMAILAVLFYRAAKPDRVVYNNLYYTAYEQLLDVYAEVTSYYSVIDRDGNKEIETAYIERGDGRKELDLEKFVEIFNSKVNFIGEPVGVIIENPQTKKYDLYRDCYDLLGESGDIFELGNFSTLTNGMRIKFSSFRDHDSQNDILVATIDINGALAPNSVNKDIIQFEISQNGVFPLGVLERNSNLLAFNILSRYVKTDNSEILLSFNMIEPYIVDYNDKKMRNLNYDEAACLADVPYASHNYIFDIVENKPIRKCAKIIPHCNIKDNKGYAFCELQTVKP